MWGMAQGKELERRGSWGGGRWGDGVEGGDAPAVLLA